jgi:uncharacterized membrane protein
MPIYTVNTIFTTIDYPSATNGTVAAGINDSGQIVGSSSGGGFLLNGDSFTALMVGSSPTTPIGINNPGQVVGTYRTHGSPATILDFGFLYSNGTYTTFSNSSVLNDINDLGQIVGTWGGFPTQGYLYSGGTSTPIKRPAGESLFWNYSHGHQQRRADRRVFFR